MKVPRAPGRRRVMPDAPASSARQWKWLIECLHNDTNSSKRPQCRELRSSANTTIASQNAKYSPLAGVPRASRSQRAVANVDLSQHRSVAPRAAPLQSELATTYGTPRVWSWPQS